MSVKDMFLALCVVFIWGVNFVVIKVGLHEMPPFLLAGLRFLLVAFPAIFFIGLPKIPIRWLFAYGLTISFGQFSFLFLAIKLGMPAGIASLVIQSQAFFTIFFGVLLLSERCKWNHIAGVLVACIGMYLLAGASMKTQGNNSINLGTLLLTLGAAVSWALGNIANKIILRNNQVSGIALVVWSSLVTVVPFFVCSWVFEGGGSSAREFARDFCQNSGVINISLVFCYYIVLCRMGIFVGSLRDMASRATISSGPSSRHCECEVIIR